MRHVLLLLLIALTVATGVPLAAGQGTVGDPLVDFVADDLDAYWRTNFRLSPFAYTSPFVTVVDHPVQTGCGRFLPGETPAFYCWVDQTVYLDAPGMDVVAEFGDFAVAFAVAHEWAHHVQAQVGVTVSDYPDQPGELYSIESELMADCFAGVWTEDADRRGLLDPGDVEEAILLTLVALGDPAGTDPGSRGAHGTNTQRVGSFLQGYNAGFDGCDFTLGRAPSRVQAPAPLANLAVALPTVGEVPAGLVPAGEGARGEDELAAGFPDPADAAARLAGWAWQENAYRDFGAADAAAPGATTSLEVSLHRFAMPEGAAGALPYFAEARAEALGLRAVAIDRLGDQSAAVGGAVAAGVETTVYVRVGAVLARVSAAAPDDPMADARFVAAGVAASLAGGVSTVTALATLLPVAGEVPEGLIAVVDGARTIDEVAATFRDPADAADRLAAWGWRENAHRTFGAASRDALRSGAAASVEVSLHRFGSAEAAAEAMAYFAATRADALGLRLVPVGNVGDQTLAVSGPVDAGTETTVYARLGEVVARVSAVAPAGDPIGDAVAVARAVAARAG